MDPQINSAINEDEHPLVILQYQGFLLILRIFAWLFITSSLYMIAFHPSITKSATFKSNLAMIVFFILAIGLGRVSIDLLFTKNLKIYRDRAVKTYHIFDDLVFPLSGSNIGYFYYQPGPLPGKYLYIAPKKIRRFTDPFTNQIYFDCGLARKKGIKELETALRSLGIEIKD